MKILAINKQLYLRDTGQLDVQVAHSLWNDLWDSLIDVRLDTRSGSE